MGGEGVRTGKFHRPWRGFLASQGQTAQAVLAGLWAFLK